MSINRIDPLLLTAKTVCWVFFGLLAAVTVLLIVIAFAFPIGLTFLPDGIMDADVDLNATQGLAVGLCIAAMGLLTGLVAYVLRLLIRIIESVGMGDPFIPENADRLNRMAWTLLLSYGLGYLVVAGLVYLDSIWGSESEAFDMALDVVDPTSLLTILILFILARVFRQGTAMRDDLEGTV